MVTQKPKAKVKVKPQKNYTHIVVLVINMVNAQLKRQGVKFVKRLVTKQKFAEVNTEKQNKMMAGQIISLPDAQALKRKTQYSPCGG